MLGGQPAQEHPRDVWGLGWQRIQQRRDLPLDFVCWKMKFQLTGQLYPVQKGLLTAGDSHGSSARPGGSSLVGGAYVSQEAAAPGPGLFHTCDSRSGLKPAPVSSGGLGVWGLSKGPWHAWVSYPWHHPGR